MAWKVLKKNTDVHWKDNKKVEQNLSFGYLLDNPKVLTLNNLSLNF